MIDIHSHVLTGLDDGARDFDTSIELCRIAALTGTTVLTATPHLMCWNTASSLLEARDEKLRELRYALEEEQIDLELAAGVELLCDDEIFQVGDLSPFTLNGSRYLLIEFDFSGTSEEDVAAWCDHLLSRGFVPIIAHPERYAFVNDDITSIERLSEKNILFQLNCGSAVGMFGEQAARMALLMLRCGYADLLASDAHTLSRRTTDLSRMLQSYPPVIGREVIERATERTPELILKNQTVLPNVRYSFSEFI